MSHPLKASARKVQEALAALGLSCRVRELPASTRSAVDAAQAIGCPVAQIVKSLVFRTVSTNRPVLVLAGGNNRVDEKKIGRLISEKIKRADPDYVREKTGFAIGGVPPLGHETSMITFIDEALLACPELWAAAGTPHAVFPLTPEDLRKMTGGRVVAVS